MCFQESEGFLACGLATVTYGYYMVMPNNIPFGVKTFILAYFLLVTR